MSGLLRFEVGYSDLPAISIAAVGSPSASEKCKSPTDSLAPGTNTGRYIADPGTKLPTSMFPAVFKTQSHTGTKSRTTLLTSREGPVRAPCLRIRSRSSSDRPSWLTYAPTASGSGVCPCPISCISSAVSRLVQAARSSAEGAVASTPGWERDWNSTPGMCRDEVLQPGHPSQHWNLDWKCLGRTVKVPY